VLACALLLLDERGREHLALPLIANLLRRKSFDQADSLIEAAVPALLCLKTGETWDPRETLLISRPVLRYGSDSPANAFRLLESWRKVATGLGQDELACALELQVAVGRRWVDGDAALEAFRQIRSPRFASMCDRLFSDWRSLVVEATLERESGEPEPPGSVWVHALVDAARAGADGAPSFRRAVRKWLDETGRAPATLQQSRGVLGTLTLDLDVGSSLRRTSPTLQRLLSTRRQGEPAVSASRRRWVERLGVADLFPDVLEFWRRHAANLMPDPASATGSNYDDCADWLAAVFELDSAAYRQVELARAIWTKDIGYASPARARPSRAARSSTRLAVLHARPSFSEARPRKAEANSITLHSPISNAAGRYSSAARTASAHWSL
jgi:hypothetical protein